MAISELKNKTAKGLIWGGLGVAMSQVVSMIFGIFLARILSAEDYGIVGLLFVFSHLAMALTESGFVKGLINRPGTQHADYNAVFWFNILMGVGLYGVLFFCAPLIARFYHDARLVSLSRYMFLSVIFAGISIAPSTYLTKKMMIKQKSIISWCSLIVSSSLGLGLALKGFAYWGLVTQNLINYLVSVSLLFIVSKWKPTLPVSFTPVREMFRYSFNLLLKTVVDIINKNLFTIFLAKFFSLPMVGNYNQANKWSMMGYTTLGNTLLNVTQPMLVYANTDKARHKQAFRKIVRFAAFTGFPLMLGLAFIAKEFIVILITDKWIASASMMSILCIGYAFTTFSWVFSELLAERGRSSRHLFISIATCILQLGCLFLLHPFGISIMLLSNVGIQFLLMFLWFGLANKEIGYSLKEFLLDAFPYAGVAVFSILSAYFALHGVHNIYLLLVLKILVMSGLYIIILYLLNAKLLRESFEYLKQLVVKQKQ